jgi:hypothetical protein
MKGALAVAAIFTSAACSTSSGGGGSTWTTTQINPNLPSEDVTPYPVPEIPPLPVLPPLDAGPDVHDAGPDGEGQDGGHD